MCVIPRMAAGITGDKKGPLLLSRYAEERVPDDEFIRERRLANGWTINTKEELLYYRIFKETYGESSDLSWMGRTKGAPRAPEA